MLFLDDIFRLFKVLYSQTLHRSDKISSSVDLSIPSIPCYKDKGYADAYCKDINATMDKASREHPLTIEKIRRNIRITRKRSPGERPYSVIKVIMNGGPYPRHHGEKVQSQGNVSLPWLQCTHHDHIEKTG